MVRRKCTPSEITYAYKSLSFFDFLLTYPYSEEKFNNFYQELHVLNALPHHANIMAPSRALVTMSLDGLNKAPSDGDSRLVCGTLYRYPGRQSLQQLLDKSTSNSKRLPLGSKAKWAYQMSSAMATVHASNQYHMDLRPANILLNEEQDAVLMKWEQSDTSEHFVAPEAEGDWDVELTSADGASCLVANSGMLAYKYHPRPVLAERRRWPSANVFPIWQKACPLALEAAEMYSLGKTLWSIFEQADEKCCQVHSSILEPGSLRWDAKSADIPDSWKQFVNVCVSYDANERGRFADAATFWEHELETLGQRDMCGHCNGTGRMA
ncbi:MAG: hypothetical protein M1828_004131 [Chrysothrix sp. TS-e1954]|nr:MAG: hypothetical protein M1828_004131 [Chrysothrix sp. TS-e1954]